MTILTFSIILFFFSILAGLVGSLTGLGGGVVIIPVLVLLFKVNIHYAMGASLISVIATSSGSAAAFLREGYTNLRIGIFLEVGAVLGALVGALMISIVSKNLLMLLFSGVLFFSAYLTLKRKEENEFFATSHPWAERLKLESTYPLNNQLAVYRVQNVPLAFSIMTIAGILSGLLGIGSGALKVLAMDHALKLPYKVATTTSNFMIGITAAVSAGIYFSYGYIDPAITFPVMLGVVLGSFIGAKTLAKVSNYSLRLIFCIVICLIALQMTFKALGNL